ncbi:restriction endonuclease subunit S [Pseudomonas aeruginosa]|nr:restriction endonuclease subunit S [Pseudomonas aeruginosa]MCS9307434.1 restriction endonuclease subunit S [Pseudomonas aeruginosa]MCS9325789.1 restriction endonuclease subunit S [Pseudomonas aeruginosa]
MMDFPPDAQSMYRLRDGDLLVNEGGSYIGRSAIWRGELDECYYQKALHRLRPHSRMKDTSEFFLYVMEMATQQGVFVAGGNQTTIDHLTAEQLRKYRFAFPPMEEQLQIGEFLSVESSRNLSTTAEAEKLIGFLQERRSALISAAVTGKIDVRGWQPPARTQAPESAVAEAV